ncbi:MAG: leucine-rich repeat domain-containing protein [Erysipelotrichaceae bacterium]|nr:leucine-rich repeat domain-containing protein [Erysipelotrichaceae bacterium]
MAFTIIANTLKKYEGNDTHVIIPEGIEAIADYAFYGAAMMEQVTFPESLREIGSDVFYGCEKLKEAWIPDGVSWMGSAVFSRCANLEKVRLSKRLTSLPKITFFQCANLKEVILPSVRRLSRACFQQCHSLDTIELPSSLKIIEDNAFDDCISLQEIELPQGIEEIGENAFFNCASLRRINLPSSLIFIGKGALETHGRIRIDADESIYLAAGMLENNWNMNWNFGSNGLYNGRNEDNYQLYDSWLCNLDLNQWKPFARSVLTVNYLESFRRPLAMYDSWFLANKEECLEMIITGKRYKALYQALDLQLVTSAMIAPYLSRIKEPDERAKLLEISRSQEEEDLLDLL